jgi:drug/metabolite transporter (DMT)-like permease
MKAIGRYRLGLLLVSTAAVAWSSSGYFTRLITLDSGTMLVWRGLWGALGLFAFIALRKGTGAFVSFRRMGRPGLLFALISTLGMMCFITALRFTTVAHVAVIYSTVPFIAAGLAWLVMRERPSLSAMLAACGALAGVLVMEGLGGEGGAIGDLLALAMTLAMASMMVIARHYQGIAVLPAACLACLLSGIASLPLAGHVLVSAHDMIALALFGLVNSALGTALFAIGSRLLPAVETGLLSALDAPLAPVWVWLVFGEAPSNATLLGALIVFSAVFAHILAGLGSRAVAARRRANA